MATAMGEEANVVRYARGRRPFLMKKSVASANEGGESEEAREEKKSGEEDGEDWWAAKAGQVRDWLRSNPLHLGMDDDSVQLVKKMLYKGDHSTDENVRGRCWKHVVIEMESVPGHPLADSDKLAVNEAVARSEADATAQKQHTLQQRLLDEQRALSRASALSPLSPETSGAADDVVVLDLPAGGGNNEDHGFNNDQDAGEDEVKQSEGDALTRLHQDQEAEKPAAADGHLPTAIAARLERRRTEGDSITKSKDGEDGEPPKVSTPLGKSRSFRSATGSSVVSSSKPMTQMSMLERQDYSIQRRNARTVKLRVEQSEREIEGCTHKPQKFTRRGSYDNVESVVKQQSSPTNVPATSDASSSSPTKRFAFPAGDVPSVSSLSLVSAGNGASDAAPQQPQRSHSFGGSGGGARRTSQSSSKASFLEECQQLLRQRSDVSLGSEEDRDTATSEAGIIDSLTKPKMSGRRERREREKRAAERAATEAQAAKNKLKRKSSFTRRKSVTQNLEKALESSSLLNACKADLDRETKIREELEAIETARLARAAEEARRADEKQARDAEAAAAAAALAEAERAEAERQPLFRFATSSTVHRGKVELQDYHDFALDSFYRKRDRGSSKPGVSLLMGRREDDGVEQVVSVIFDRTKFSEEAASDWVSLNEHRFPRGKNARRAEQ